MTEMRQLTQEQAMDGLLDAVAEVLCSCLYIENQEEAYVSHAVLGALEDAYDTVMSFRVEDTTQEATP